MSVEVDVKLTRSTPVSDLLGDVESYLVGIPHDPVIMMKPSGDAASVRVEPGEEAPSVYIATGRKSRVKLWNIYHRPSLELRLRPDLPQSERKAIEEASGWWSVITIFRTRPSFCLAALLACSLARRNGVMIRDLVGYLPTDLDEGRVEPDELLALFSRWQNVPSFEVLADLFCEEIGYEGSPGFREFAELDFDE